MKENEDGVDMPDYSGMGIDIEFSWKEVLLLAYLFVLEREVRK